MSAKTRKVSCPALLLRSVKIAQRRRFFWSEYRKIPIRKNSVFEHFSRSAF